MIPPHVIRVVIAGLGAGADGRGAFMRSVPVSLRLDWLEDGLPWWVSTRLDVADERRTIALFDIEAARGLHERIGTRWEVSELDVRDFDPAGWSTVIWLCHLDHAGLDRGGRDIEALGARLRAAGRELARIPVVRVGIEVGGSSKVTAEQIESTLGGPLDAMLAPAVADRHAVDRVLEIVDLAARRARPTPEAR